MTVEYRPNRAGVAELLKSFAPLVNESAQKVAGNVRSQKPDARVEVEGYTTDRAAAQVTIVDARGRLWQVRDGILTRAASAAGLEVRAR